MRISRWLQNPWFETGKLIDVYDYYSFHDFEDFALWEASKLILIWYSFCNVKMSRMSESEIKVPNFKNHKTPWKLRL